ncbi:protease htpX [Desulfovibrio sp. X2]|uniref:zinc metalloprotease HtpX n=1 Tax=Desulfovibrio sp. X2 TaxID=941449 RepID=UPI00035894C3|nr:zinc metalloprotease HtpX [Desulfovibrio sp. X2]EPR43103.1 protease htpX [Desulfovibrio sp. X2]
MTSQLKTALLLGALTAIILLIGQAMGGRSGLMIAFVLALVMNVGSYWFSDKIVLSMYRARELAPEDAPGLHAMVEDLARNAGIPKPRLVIIPQQAPNAFATGRNPQNAVVAVTEGIVRTLSPEELRGVLSHELGHVLNRDILIQTVAAVLASVIMVLASIARWSAIFGGFSGRDDEGGNPLALIAMALFAPLAATLIQMAISRSREFLADATGARISGTPLALASALGKLEASSRRVPLQANPSTENMFIVSPFSGASLGRWFSTHPPTEERIARLRAMAGQR